MDYKKVALIVGGFIAISPLIVVIWALFFWGV